MWSVSDKDKSRFMSFRAVTIDDGISRFGQKANCEITALLSQNNGICSFETVLTQSTDGFVAIDNADGYQEHRENWLSNLRVAHNICDQNVEILLQEGHKVDVKLPSRCKRHPDEPENTPSFITPVCLRTLKAITIGSELLVWPGIFISLIAELPRISLDHVKDFAQYYCPSCQEVFAEPNTLKAHIYLQICGKPPSKLPAVISESFSHTSPMPRVGHSCPHCGKRYARRYSLMIHARTHTGQKPLVCKVCSRRFGDPSNLNKHQRIHATNTQSNPYICRICGNISARRRDLERHMRNKHNE